MTAVTDLTVQLDGTELNTYAWNIGMGGWRFATAAKRGENPVVPLREGRVWQEKCYDGRTLQLPMWVIGADPEDGEVPVESGTFEAIQNQLFENVRDLQRLFTSHKALRTLEVYDPNLEKEIEASVEVVDTMDFTTMAGLTRAVFVATLYLPYVWFRDKEYLFDGAEVGTLTERADNETWEVAVDTDHEIYDALISIRGNAGGVANPTITNVENGHWLKYNGTVGNGEVLAIDCGNMTCTLGGVDKSGLLTWSTARRQMFMLFLGDNTIRYDGDAGATADVRLRWKGCYW